MKTGFRTFIALFAVTLFGGALSLPAAESGMARVLVPFPFTAGTVALPAGDYIVSQTAGHVVTITGKGGDAMVMVVPAASITGSTSYALTFEKTSKGNLLKEVQTSGSTSNLVNVLK